MPVKNKRAHNLFIYIYPAVVLAVIIISCWQLTHTNIPHKYHTHMCVSVLCVCVCLPTPAQVIIIMSLSLAKYKFNVAVQYEIYKYTI